MTYFITGASDGLGKSLAEILLKENDSKVVGLSRSKPEITNLTDYIELDLTDETSIKKAADKIAQTDGEINLINCAGVMAREEELDFAEIERVFKTNTTGVMLLESLLLNPIKARGGGMIINVISTSALRGDVAQPIYSTSKWAIRGFTKGLQARLKGTGVRVVSFVPGGFLTKMSEKIGKPISNPRDWMPVEDVAYELASVVKAPKTFGMSEVVINRK
jgi:short-subunit dehydrogenase